MRRIICKVIISIFLIVVCAALVNTYLKAIIRSSSITAGENKKVVESTNALSFDYLLYSAPDIEGLFKEINLIGDRPEVVYKAQKDNPYSLDTESYAGEFKQEVFINEKKVGGIALIPKVIRSIINNYHENEIKLIIPLEINKNDEFLPMNITFVSRSMNKLGCILISFTGYLDFIDSSQNTDGFIVSSNSMTIGLFSNKKSMILENYKVLVPVQAEDKESNYVLTYYLSENSHCDGTNSLGFGFGDNLNIQVSSPFLISISEYSLTEESLITIKNKFDANVPIFITAVSK